jgi:hypothetical protein
MSDRGAVLARLFQQASGEIGRSVQELVQGDRLVSFELEL